MVCRRLQLERLTARLITKTTATGEEATYTFDVPVYYLFLMEILYAFRYTKDLSKKVNMG